MNTEVGRVKERSLAKGLVAGLIGGIAGTIAMSLAERILPDRYRAADKSQLHEVEPLSWEFGLAIGAAYGALAEFFPAAANKDGASFGMTLGVLTQQPALPEPDTAAEAEDESSAITAHIVYGVTTEFVRRFVRKRI